MHDRLAAARRGWWMVLVVVVVALGVAIAIVLETTPQYATAVTLFVATPGRDANALMEGSLFARQRVNSYAQLLMGDRIATSVASDAGFSLKPDQIQDRVAVRVVPDTVLIEVTVVDSDPARSRRLASALVAHFTVMVTALETTGTSASVPVKINTVSGPSLSSVPVSPRLLRSLTLAGLAGLLVGIALAVLRYRYDVTIRCAETLQDAGTVPVLAVVPVARAAALPPPVPPDRPPMPVEAFRRLRVNLRLSEVGGPARIIVITSSMPGDGKSATAVGLAMACAESGQRVLLLEGDLRRPRLAECLGLDCATGLSNVLAGEACLDDAIRRYGPRELYLLAGEEAQARPSELVGSPAMVALLARVRDTFDVILIDTPPVLAMTDAAVLAAHADGVLLVVRSGRTTQAQARAALANLRMVNARIVGYVLNLQPSRGDGDCRGWPQSTDHRRAPDLRQGAGVVVVAPRAPAMAAGPTNPAGPTVGSVRVEEQLAR